ncbi:MAG: fimbrillin family protein, partial [Alistipes sp.]|nr:fimbrillin family protein [Alistipes sp.]
MKRFVIYISLMMVAALVAVGCLSDHSEEVQNLDSKRVRLWADVGYSPNIVYSPSSTRGNANSTSGIIDAATDTVISIGMARIDEVYSLSYPAFVDCGEPILAEMGLPNPNNSYIRDIVFTSAAQFFYNTTDYVKYVAWQPWRPGEEGYEYNSTSKATTVRIPITGDSDILYGNVTTGSQTEGFELMKFDHALCVYRIYVYTMQEEGTTQSMAWGALEDMEIEELPTSCVLTLPTDDEGLFGIAYEGSQTLNLSDENNNIYFSPGEKIPVGLSNRRMVAKCVAAPPTDGMLNISLSTSAATARQRVSIARNFKAGHAYDIVLRFSNHGLINADVSVSDWKRHDEVVEQEVDVDMFYNLSNYETANSYIVNSSNYGYCFDGTVKGNGDNSLVGG